MLHLLKTAKTISGRRGEGKETTIKIVGEKIRMEVKRGTQDTVQHFAKSEGRVGVRREARVINVPFMR